MKREDLCSLSVPPDNDNSLCRHIILDINRLSQITMNMNKIGDDRICENFSS